MKGTYFYTTNGPVMWVARRGIIFAALFQPAALVMGQVADNHWAFTVGQWTLMALSVILLIAHIGSHNATCDRTAKTGEDLKKRRYRLVLAYARTWPVAVAGIAVFMVVTPIIRPSQGDQPHDKVSLPYTAIMTGILWLGLSLLAAYLFRARNSHHIATREPSPRAQKLTERIRRICHRSHWFVAGSILGLLCAVIFLPEKGAWSSITSCMSILVLAAYAADARHSDTLCETCVAEFRVDAPEYAASKSWVFTVEHKGRAVYWVVALVAIAIQLSLDDTAASKAATLGINTLFLASAFVNRFHRSYSPWCPYCRDNGDGGHEHTEVPDPTGGHGRPVPV